MRTDNIKAQHSSIAFQGPLAQLGWSCHGRIAWIGGLVMLLYSVVHDAGTTKPMQLAVYKQDIFACRALVKQIYAALCCLLRDDIVALHHFLCMLAERTSAFWANMMQKEARLTCCCTAASLMAS